MSFYVMHIFTFYLCGNPLSVVNFEFECIYSCACVCVPGKQHIPMHCVQCTYIMACMHTGVYTVNICRAISTSLCAAAC